MRAGIGADALLLLLEADPVFRLVVRADADVPDDKRRGITVPSVPAVPIVAAGRDRDGEGDDDESDCRPPSIAEEPGFGTARDARDDESPPLFDLGDEGYPPAQGPEYYDIDPEEFRELS